MPLNGPVFDSKPWVGIGVNCQFIFHLLGGQRIADIFTSPFWEVIDFCITKVPGAVPDYVDSGRDADIVAGLQDLSRLFKRTTRTSMNGTTWDQTTLVDLVTGNVMPDLQIQGVCAGLKQLGCFFPFDHIPPGMHHHAQSLMAHYRFLDSHPTGVGDQPLHMFLTTNDPEFHRIARKAKQAGILRVLANPFQQGEVVKASGVGNIGDGNGYCCAGGQCQQVAGNKDPDDYYCESTNPPNAGPCNAMADPC